MQGFKSIFFGHKEPQNHEVLWLHPSPDHQSVDMLYYWNDGWTVINSYYIINRIKLDKLVKFVSYDEGCSTLQFYDFQKEKLYDITLDNLNGIIKEAVANGAFDSETGTMIFYNHAGEKLFSIDQNTLFTAGDGIAIESNNISLVLDPDTESYLTLTDSGLKLSGIDAIADRVTALESTSSSLETDMATAQADIDSLEERMDTAESDIDSLEGRMDTAESDIDSLESRMDTAESGIDSLESRMDTAESDIGSLETVTTSELIASAEYSSRYQALYYYAKDGTLVSTVDASELAKDGMIDSITLEVNPTGYTGPYLHFVFNDDADKDDIYVSLSYLKDEYTAGDGVKVSSDLVISLDEDYLAGLLPNYVKLEADYSSGLMLAHLLVNNNSKDLYAPYASDSQYGVMQTGDGLSAEDGVISVAISADSEGYLTMKPDGLSVNGIDDILASLTTAEANIVTLQDAVSAGLVASAEYISSQKAILLYSQSGAILSTIDVADFLVDGMLASVTLETNPTGYEEGAYLHFVFNTDSAKDDVYVSLSYLVETYTGGNGINVSSNYVISVDEDYIAELVAGDVQYVTDYSSGLTIGHLVVNEASTDVIVPYGTEGQYGVVQAGAGLVSTDGELSLDLDYVYEHLWAGNYTTGLLLGSMQSLSVYVPYATVAQAGVVIIGDGLQTESGVISIIDSYITDIISDTVTYANVSDDGLTIGTLTVNGGELAITTQLATADDYGVVKVSTGLDVEDGVISINDDYLKTVINEEYIDSFIGTAVTYSADYTSGISLSTIGINDKETVTYAPYANSSQAGVVSIGDGIDVTSAGAISINDSYITDLIDSEYIYSQIDTELKLSTTSAVYLVGAASSSTTSTGTLYMPSAAVGDDTSIVYMAAGGMLTKSVKNVGSATTPVYLDTGEITVSEAYVGSNSIPVYMDAGTITASTYDLSEISSDIESLETRMSTAESDIDTLQAAAQSELGATITYNTSTKTILLTAADGSTLGSIDATDFIKDGMVSSAELTTTNASGTTGTYIKFTFNTDADSDPIYLDVADLVDIYTAGDGIIISDNVVSVDDAYLQSVIDEDYLAGLLDDNYVSAVKYTNTYGGVTVGSLAVTTGSTTSTTAITINYATSDKAGLVIVGDGLSVSSGTISLDDDYVESLVNASDISGQVSYSASVTSGTALGALTTGSSTYTIYAPTTSYTATATSGATIGTIVADGTSAVLYAPYTTVSSTTSTLYLLGITSSTATTTSNALYKRSSAVGSSTQPIYITSAGAAATCTSYSSWLTSNISNYVGDGLTVSSGVISVDDTYVSSLVSSGSSVTWTASLDSGTVIGTLGIDGTDYTLYAPSATETTEAGVTVSTTASTLYVLGVTSTTTGDYTTLYRRSSAIGSSSQPVYINSSGAITTCTSYSSWASSNIGSYVSYAASTTDGIEVGTLTIGDNSYVLYAPESGDSGSVVTWSGSLSSGTVIGTLGIDGTEYTLYAPVAESAEAGITVSSTTSTFYPLGLTATGSGTYTTAYYRSSAVGSSTTPMYLSSAGALTACTSYSSWISSNIDSYVSYSASTTSGTAVGTLTIGSTDYTLYAPSATTESYTATTISSAETVYFTGVSAEAEGTTTVLYYSSTSVYASSGSVYASAFYESSDVKLKENIKEINEEEVAKAASVELKSFNFKEGDTSKKYGVIAQEVEDAGLSELVKINANTGMRSVDYISLLVLKIQALEKRVAELEAKLS